MTLNQQPGFSNTDKHILDYFNIHIQQKSVYKIFEEKTNNIDTIFWNIIFLIICFN